MSDDKQATYDQVQTAKLARTSKQIVESRGYTLVQFLYDDSVVKSVWGKITTSRARPHSDHFRIQVHEENRDKGSEEPRLHQAMLQNKYGF